ncbi:MAG TPA: hypothetical protein VFK06_18655 [Candidatus Angelobacter sp.]|nr:hypothetical protein [Candidatus Angelobacter sp.]
MVGFVDAAVPRLYACILLISRIGFRRLALIVENSLHLHGLFSLASAMKWTLSSKTALHHPTRSQCHFLSIDFFSISGIMRGFGEKRSAVSNRQSAELGRCK